MRLRLCLLLLLLVPSVAHTQERCPIEVIDADTVRTCEGRIRLRTCNAPERFMPGGTAAASRLQDLIDNADYLEVLCHREPECRDVFNRQLCDLVVDGEDACVILVAERYAKPQNRMRLCSRVKPTDRRPLLR